MTTFLLIRHASHDLLGKGLAGRAGGISLNAQGNREAERLAERLDGVRVDAVYSSPRERTLETALPVASRKGLKVRTLPGIDEIDFGDWTGRSFSELERDPHWPVWIHQRSAAQPPNGETIHAVRNRAVDALQELSWKHPHESVAVFSHGDVIKSVLANCLGSSLDGLERFEIAPASVSVVVVGGGWSQVTLVNDTGCYAAANGG